MSDLHRIALKESIARQTRQALNAQIRAYEATKDLVLALNTGSINLMALLAEESASIIQAATDPETGELDPKVVTDPSGTFAYTDANGAVRYVGNATDMPTVEEFITGVRALLSMAAVGGDLAPEHVQALIGQPPCEPSQIKDALNFWRKQ